MENYKVDLERVSCCNRFECKQGPCIPANCFNEQFKCVWFAIAIKVAEDKLIPADQRNVFTLLITLMATRRAGCEDYAFPVSAKVKTGCNARKPRLPDLRVSQSYMQPSISLYNEDCRQTMKRIPDGSVDLILQDPPYGTTGNDWDIAPNFAEMWPEWERILADDGVVIMTVSQPFTSDLILSRRGFFKHTWVWNKKLAGNGILAKQQPLKIHEDVVVFAKGKCKYNPIMKNGLYRAKGGIVDKHGTFNGAESEITHNDQYYPTSIIEYSGAGLRSDRIHPTEKPIDLMRYLILTYSNKGDTVFDGYSGSGTTAHACLVEGRKFVGSELDKSYFEKSVKRLKNVPTQLF